MFYHPYVPGLLYEMAAEYNRTGVAKIPAGRREDVIKALSLTASISELYLDAYQLLLQSMLMVSGSPRCPDGMKAIDVARRGLESLSDDDLAVVALSYDAIDILYTTVGMLRAKQQPIAQSWWDAEQNAPELPVRHFPTGDTVDEVIAQVFGPDIDPAEVERIKKSLPEKW